MQEGKRSSRETHSFKVVRLGDKWGGVWEGKWGQEKFLEDGEVTACLYADSADPTQRRKLTMGGGCREAKTDVFGWAREEMGAQGRAP